jgi:hypothetical protein
MDRVLVLYPSLFECETKFRRKLDAITERMNAFDLLCPEDANGFAGRYAEDSGKVSAFSTNPNWKADASITHAIVFDDREEFEQEREWLRHKDIPVRWVRTPLTRVINLKKEPEYQERKKTATYEYIGRGSQWGNPYSMFENNESREEVIRKYQYDFERDLLPRFRKADVLALSGKRLGCFCKPASCHGDVIASYLNAHDDGN